MTTVRSPRFLSAAAIAATAVLALSACAGSAGSGGGGGGTGGGTGFDYGASQEDVDAALAELDPVNIVYQAGAQGPNSVSAQSAHDFKEYVEERSGGKITVEVIWAQAIAGYSEIDDALADGRIDVSYALPIYDPSTYPAFDALATTSDRASAMAPARALTSATAPSASLPGPPETTWTCGIPAPRRRCGRRRRRPLRRRGIAGPPVRASPLPRLLWHPAFSRARVACILGSRLLSSPR